MASRLRTILCALIVVLSTAALPTTPSVALAAGLDAKGEAEAKEASRLYRAGDYEAAAKLFAGLASDYPDLNIFERNLGACFYYLRKPEPAVSNLRNYLNHRKDIPADDRATVERWIAEMEALRAQNAAALAAPPSTGPATAQASLPAQPEPGAAAPAAPAGLDVSAANTASEGPSAKRPIYKTWWLWTGVGAAVVAGVVTAVLLSRGSDDFCAGSGNRCEVVK